MPKKARPPHTITRRYDDGSVCLVSGSSGTEYALSPHQNFCPCKGFQCRKRCSHLDEVRADARSRFCPCCNRPLSSDDQFLCRLCLEHDMEALPMDAGLAARLYGDARAALGQRVEVAA